MEDVIRKYFCNFCTNKTKDCMNIEVSKEKEVIIYRCLNCNLNCKKEIK